MSSVLVSNYMGMKERLFHPEISAQNAVLSQQYLDLMTQASETSGLGKTDLPGCRGAIPATNVSAPPITRRHSSSMYFPNPTPLTPLTETTGFFSNVLGSGLETVTEERFRSRAFSEGASMLSCDSSLDQQQQLQSSSSRYKTELCRPFEENGKCKYGDKCQFAHGKHELRHMVRHPKYKTELCRTYHTSGLCPYGPRCHFIHNQDEPTIGMQRQAAAARIQQTASVPVSISNPIQRQSSLNRPSNLQLIAQQRSVGRLNSFSHSPPLETQSPFFGVNENAVMSPISPLGGQTFNYNKYPLSSKTNNFRRMSENRQPSPVLGFAALGQVTDLPGSDDHVFDSPLTPPDSDRESATGSPPGFAAPAPCPQRLPIFRCLSQSE